jgi:hypothetical protein
MLNNNRWVRNTYSSQTAYSRPLTKRKKERGQPVRSGKGSREERRERQAKAKSLLKIQEALVTVKDKEEANRHIMNLPANIIRCRENAQSEKTSHISCGIKSVMRLTV